MCIRDRLKTETSKSALPIPQSLALALSAHVARWSTDETVLANEWGDQLGPWALQRAMRTARAKVAGLPSGFRFHDLRHYLASMLITRRVASDATAGSIRRVV